MFQLLSLRYVECDGDMLSIRVPLEKIKTPLPLSGSDIFTKGLEDSFVKHRGSSRWTADSLLGKDREMDGKR